MTNSSPNNNTQTSLQKMTRSWFKLLFTANGKHRYALIGGLFGVFYGILSYFFPAAVIKGVAVVAYLISFFVMVPLSKVLPLSTPSMLPLVPQFTPLGSAVWAAIYFSFHAGLGAIAGALIGKLPSRALRYTAVLSLLILWLGFIGFEYYARYTSTRAYKTKERADDRGAPSLQNSGGWFLSM